MVSDDCTLQSNLHIHIEMNAMHSLSKWIGRCTIRQACVSIFAMLSASGLGYMDILCEK